MCVVSYPGCMCYFFVIFSLSPFCISVSVYLVLHVRFTPCNVFTCSEHYNVSVNGIVYGAFNVHSVKSLRERRMPVVYYSSALATLGLLMIRRGLLYVSNMSADDINALLSAVCRSTNCQ